jgi:hypothetical protein
MSAESGPGIERYKHNSNEVDHEDGHRINVDVIQCN